MTKSGLTTLLHKGPTHHVHEALRSQKGHNEDSMTEQIFVKMPGDDAGHWSRKVIDG